MRTGAVAKKSGDDPAAPGGRPARAGHRPASTVSRSLPAARRSRDGYAAVQLGAGSAKAKNLTKPERGHFGKAEVEPKAEGRRVPGRRGCALDVGVVVAADDFVAGEMVDVQGVTQGKGFAGAMKRWNFAGLRATQRRLALARAHGSTGQRQDPGRSSRTRRWPAIWVRRTAPSRISRSCRPTFRAAFFVEGLGARLEGRLAARQGREGRVLRRGADPRPQGTAQRSGSKRCLMAGLVDEAASTKSWRRPATRSRC